jgi:hypothetical protein
VELDLGDKKMHIHIDTQVGFDCDGIVVEEKTDIHGKKCWKASITPTHLFGMEVDAAPIEGIGRTKKEAIERMNKNQKEFYDGMWV